MIKIKGNNRKSPTYSDQVRSGGFTLLYATLIGSLLLAIATGIFNIIFKELQLTSSSRESFVAFYAADTGLECSLYWDLSQGVFLSSDDHDPPQSGVLCNGIDITQNWTVNSNPSSATTEFDITFLPEPYCTHVVVSKVDGGETLIESRGYNTCDTNNPRRVERGIKATY